jgi:hypothetical protein
LRPTPKKERCESAAHSIAEMLAFRETMWLEPAKERETEVIEQTKGERRKIAASERVESPMRMRFELVWPMTESPEREECGWSRCSLKGDRQRRLAPRGGRAEIDC